jgi:hypothetical protein
LDEQEELSKQLLPLIDKKATFDGLLLILDMLCFHIKKEEGKDLLTALEISEILTLDFSGEDPGLKKIGLDICVLISHLSNEKKYRWTLAKILKICKEFKIGEHLPIKYIMSCLAWIIKMPQELQEAFLAKLSVLSTHVTNNQMMCFLNMIKKDCSFQAKEMEGIFKKWVGNISFKLKPFFNDQETSDIQLSIQKQTYYLHRSRLLCEQDHFFDGFLKEGKEIPVEKQEEALTRIKALYGVPFTQEEWDQAIALKIGFNLQDVLSYTDLTIVVNEEKIPTLKMVLSANSPYFQAMFQKAFAESSCSEIEIEDLSTEMIHKVLNYFYTNEWPIFDEKSKTNEDDFKVILKYLLVEDPRLLLTL